MNSSKRGNNHNDRGKVPFVLIHGFPFSSQIWQGVRGDLEDVAEIYTPDLPGFGSADKLSKDVSPSIEAYADSVAQWVRKEGIGGIVLGGHSMGGYVALAFARKYGTMLRGLLLICTRPGPDTEQAREGRYKLAGDVEERGPQAVVDAMHPKLFAEGADERAREQAKENMLSQNEGAIAAALHAMAGRPDSTPQLREIAVPTLIITGSEDAIIPAPEAETMGRLIPNSRHAAIEGAGHMPMLEKPRQFTGAVRSFLTDL
jgi:3-oxoadipate enol-lactonase